MGKYLLTFLTAAVGVVAAVFVTLLTLSLTQAQALGPCLKPWLIGSFVVLALLLACLLVLAGIEGRRRWRARKLSPLLSLGETLNEVALGLALGIPPENQTRVLDFWREYEEWCRSVLRDLPELDRAHFESLDRGYAPDPAAFVPPTDEQRYEVPGRVAVLRTIVRRLRGE